MMRVTPTGIGMVAQLGERAYKDMFVSFTATILSLVVGSSPTHPSLMV